MQGIDLLDLKKFRTKKEKFYFRLSIFFSIFIWIWLFSPINFFELNKPVDFTAGLIAVGILVGLQFLFIIINLSAIAYIRLNALKVSTEQFPELYKTNLALSQQIGLEKTPDIFIINSDGLLNAFATKLVFRRIIVFYSDLVDALTLEKDEKQVKAVLAHELGHHALKHTDFWVNYVISPASFIWLLSAALSRAREYSADRVMGALVKDSEICSRALIKLIAGGKIGQKANLMAYTKQINEERGFFSWFSEIHSSHPFLPKRILALQEDFIK